VRRLAYVLTCE